MFSGCGGLGTTAYALPGAIRVASAACSNGEHGSCDDVGEEPASSQIASGGALRRHGVLRGVGWHRATFSAGLMSGSGVSARPVDRHVFAQPAA